VKEARYEHKCRRCGGITDNTIGGADWASLVLTKLIMGVPDDHAPYDHDSHLSRRRLWHC